MRSRRSITVLLSVSVSLVPLAAGCGKAPPADLVFTRGVIHTLDPSKPQAASVAVRGDRIVWIGDDHGVTRFVGAETRVVHLEGRTVLPGLIDSHAHLMSLGRFLVELNLVGTRSPEDIRRMVIEKQESFSPGAWIRGRGWDQNDWDTKIFPTWGDLAGTEANPVYLRRVDGHAAWVNKTALELCGIGRRTPDPEGGRILRDARGLPTGVLIDKAMELVTSRLPRPTVEEEAAWMESAIRTCNRYGLTGVHDAGTQRAHLDVFQRLHEDGKLTLRIYALLDSDDSTWVISRIKQGRAVEAGGLVTVRAIKLYADGALGSRGAALLRAYSDDPGNSGLIRTRPETLRRWGSLAAEYGYQACTHAIGDSANRMVLDIYESIVSRSPANDLRFRIEHAQVIAPQDVGRFARLGVIPSMQPTHATSDMYWAEDRLGSERIRGAYAWRQLIDAGSRIAFGSDFPVEEVNPMLGIFAAVTRQDLNGSPEGGWLPGERITAREAIEAFTRNAAYAEFAESEKGSVEIGKLADLTVLDRDILAIPPSEIPQARVLYTVVGGRVVYSAATPE